MLNCPIHQKIDIAAYLAKNQIPQHLWSVFHELILLRGEFPLNISDVDAKIFGKRARELTVQYGVKPEEGRPLLMMFQQLIGQWAIRNPYTSGDPRMN